MNTHAHTPWRKSVLIPFWTLQLLLELLLIALLALALEVLFTWNGEVYTSDGQVEYSSGYVSTRAKILVPIWIAMLLTCLALTITEIVLLAKHKLKPATFVIMNTIKSTIWTVIFVLDVISTVDGNSRTASGIAIIIEAILYLCFLIPLIYGAIIYHRFRRDQKTYKAVIDPNAPTEYPSQYQSYAAPSADIERGAPGARRLSYNHERDTRFEAYRQGGNMSYGDANAGDIGVGERGVGAYEMDRKAMVGSPEIPTLIVDNHDEIYEMDDHNHRTELR